MTQILLYNKRGAVTGKNIAKALNLRYVRDSRWEPSDGVPVVRWGSSKYIAGDTCDLNNANAIGLCADGIRSLQIMKDSGVRVSTLYQVSRMEDIPKEKHLLARKRNHVAGTDIIDCPTYELALAAYMYQDRRIFVEYVETDLELRVHVIDGEAVKGFRKHHDDDDASFVRSSKKGWGYKRVDLDRYYSSAIPVAIKAIESLGLRMGAVDMARLVGTKDEWIVWECNSAPSLNSVTIDLYVDFIKEQLYE